MSFTCRRGHYSVSDDYCDICGARNWNAGQRMGSAVVASAAPMPASAAARASVEQPCPVCASPREGSDRFCSSCAYDFETGETWEGRMNPGVPLAPAAPMSSGQATALMLVVSVDASRSNERGCPSPPADTPEHVFFLDQPSMVIGRDDVAGVHMPITADPYVSRRHAEIVDLGGQWGIRDLGSTNGTRLNGSMLVGTEVRLLRPNDVVEIGCFSRLTIRDRSTQGVNR
jgi:hypothetical protein